MFGREIEEFSSFARAFNTCFVTLMGDFDSASLWDAAGHPLGALWFWSFHIIIVMLLLNMLLAIIFDTYTDVKAGIGNSETLFFQSQQVVRRWRQLKRGE